jgi:hypothetical protein
MVIHDDCHATVETTYELMKNYVDRRRAETQKYSKGELVMLSGKNIRTHRPYKKLVHKLHGHCKIREVISEIAIRLNLPVIWKIYKVFHVLLLERFIYGHREANLETVLNVADSIEADDTYHVSDVIGSVEKQGKISYHGKWRGFPAKKD